MRATAKKRREAAPQMLSMFDLEIDMELECVKRAGQAIALSEREYQLLVLLARNCGRVVTRSEVLASFYDDDPEAAARSNVVDVYIAFLRRKIDHGFWPRLILTRRGKGYLLRAHA